MKDEKNAAVAKLLSLLALYAIHAGRKNLAELAFLHSIRVALDSGISTYTSMAVAIHGLVHMQSGKLDLALSCGEKALNIIERFENEPGEFHVRTTQIVHSGILNAIRPFHESLDVFMKTYRMGLDTHDFEYGVLGGMNYSLCYLAMGLPLFPLGQDLATFMEEAKQFGLGPSIENGFRILRQTILNLQGKAADPSVLTGDVMDQEVILKEMKGISLENTRLDVATFQLMLACIHGDWDMAERMLHLLEPYPYHDMVVAQTHNRLTWMGMAAFALGHKLRGMNQLKYLGIGRKILKHFELSVKHGSANAHPVLLFSKLSNRPTKKLMTRLQSYLPGVDCSTLER